MPGECVCVCVCVCALCTAGLGYRPSCMYVCVVCVVCAHAALCQLYTYNKQNSYFSNILFQQARVNKWWTACLQLWLCLGIVAWHSYSWMKDVYKIVHFCHGNDYLLPQKCHHFACCNILLTPAKRRLLEDCTIFFIQSLASLLLSVWFSLLIHGGRFSKFTSWRHRRD